MTEQSKFPPSVVPLEVFISTSGGLFASQVIGRLHASDQDLQDVLTYKLVSESPTKGRFSIDPADGRIWANGSLEEGFYSLNVSVTDGKFSVWTGVRVHVWAAEQRLLDSGLSLQLVGLSPEEFLGDHWRGLQRSLGQAFGVPRQEVHLASLQQLQDSRDLEALLVWRSPAGPAQPLLPSRLAGDHPDETSVPKYSHIPEVGAAAGVSGADARPPPLTQVFCRTSRTLWGSASSG